MTMPARIVFFCLLAFSLATQPRCAPQLPSTRPLNSPRPASPDIFITGQFTNEADLDPGPGETIFTVPDSGFYLSQLSENGDFDSALVWGGTHSYWDTGLQIGTDREGSVYVAGYFEGDVNFNPGPEIDELTSNGEKDVFLLKLSGDGDQIWARSFGGPLDDQCRGLNVEPDGRSHIAGSFLGTADFDPSDASVQLSSAGDSDAFLCNLDTDGNFLWAKTWGGAGPDWATGMGVGGFGKIYDTASFEGESDFDPGAGVEMRTSNGRDDVFVLKIDSRGWADWVRCWGGPEDDRSYGVAVDPDGGSWITGGFQSTVDFDPGPGLDAQSSNGGCDVFLTRLSPSGGYLWTLTWGGPGDDIGLENICDRDGNQYITGWFEDTVDFDPGPSERFVSSHGGKDLYLSKFKPDGTLEWVITWGGPLDDEGHAVIMDKNGDVILVGVIRGTINSESGPIIDRAATSEGGDFAAKLTPSGELVWLKTWDPTTSETAG
jgi:hypothetical protein